MFAPLDCSCEVDISLYGLVYCTNTGRQAGQNRLPWYKPSLSSTECIDDVVRVRIDCRTPNIS